MIVVQRLKGKIDGRTVIFSEKILRLHKGKVAEAKGGGGSSQTTNEVVPTGPWAPQIPLINQLFSNAAGLYAGGPPQYYPTNTVNPENQLTQDTRNAAVGQINANAPQNTAAAATAATNVANAGANPVAQSGAAVQPNLNDTLNGLLGGAVGGPLGGVANTTAPFIQQILGQVGSQTPNVYSSPSVAAGGLDVNPALQAQLNGGTNPYLDSVVQGALRASNNNYNRNILPGIGDEASAAGQVGGTRQGIAQGIAAGDQAASSNDIIGRLFAQSFDQQNADRANAINTVVGAQGTNAGLGLQTNQLNEAIRQAIMGEGLQGAGLASNLVTNASQLGQQGQTAAANTASNLLTQGQALGTDATVRNAALLPLLQGQNLSQLGFANELGVQQYGFNQAQTDDNVSRWFFNQFAPYNALTQFQNYISGPYGSSVAGAPNQVTNQYTGALNPAGTTNTGGANGGIQSLFGTGTLPSPWNISSMNNDPVTGIASPWKWF